MTPPSSDEAHLSIGEVLALLQDEFPDTTVSKIRFLESQGLIDPERTPSGYRKFYDSDVERLRWILGQQRDHFLPLKVIKDRLDEEEAAAPLAPRPAPLEAGEVVAPHAPSEPHARPIAEVDAPEPPAGAPGPTRRAPSRAPRTARKPAAAPSTTSAVPSEPPRPILTLPLGYDDGHSESSDEAAPTAGSETDAAEPARATYDRISLARTAGLTDEQLDELERYGLIAPLTDDGVRPTFGADALAVARAAHGFFAQGVEARHLKMYLNFTAREADLFRQVLLPHLRQRNPQSRERAAAMFDELVRDARLLRAALLRRAVREMLGE